MKYLWPAWDKVKPAAGFWVDIPCFAPVESTWKLQEKGREDGTVPTQKPWDHWGVSRPWDQLL